jgi:hypothetical protein
MIGYRVEGRVVRIFATGTYTVVERNAVYDGISADPTVAAGCVLLIDARLNAAPNRQPDIREALDALTERLAHKLSPVCAVLEGPNRHIQAHLFQRLAAERGWRVGLFQSEPDALAWLDAYL